MSNYWNIFIVEYMCGKIKIPLRKSKNDQKNFPLARKHAREQKFPHPQTAYNLRKNGARHPLGLQPAPPPSQADRINFVFEAISKKKRFRAVSYQKINLMYGIGKKNKIYAVRLGRVCNHFVFDKKKIEKSTPTSVLTRDTNQRRLVT